MENKVLCPPGMVCRCAPVRCHNNGLEARQPSQLWNLALNVLELLVQVAIRFMRKNGRTLVVALTVLAAMQMDAPAAPLLIAAQADVDSARVVEEAPPAVHTIKGLKRIYRKRNNWRDVFGTRIYEYELKDTDKPMSVAEPIANVPDLRTFCDKHPRWQKIRDGAVWATPLVNMAFTIVLPTLLSFNNRR